MRFSRRNFLQYLGGVGLPAVGLSLPPSIKRRRYLKADRDPSSALFESWIEIDLGRLSRNLDGLRDMVKRPVLAVIKANAYGHGLLEVGAFLDSAGIAGLMVCRLAEAVRLRESGVTCPIYNFGPLLSGASESLIRNRITPILSDQGHEELARTAQRMGVRIQVHAHVDTGMHRVGIPEAGALSILQELTRQESVELTGLSTTLTEDPEFDRRQLDRFKEICKQTRERGGTGPVLRHAASSGGIFGHPDFFLDMVRPGIVLYGGYPNAATRKEDRLKLEPVLSFKTRVAEVKTLNPGDGVSYHRAYRAARKERIAVLPVGYSDGYPPRAVGRGHVLLGGLPCPIIASITANHMEVRLPRGLSVNTGDEAVLIGTQGQESVTADDVAEWAEASNYRILIGMNSRLPRVVATS